MTSLSVVASTAYGTTSGAGAIAGLLGGLFGAVIGFAIAGLLYMGIFTKAGRPAWEAYVPFYNTYILITQIVGRPAWWFWVIIVSSLIPVLNFITWIVALVFLILLMNDVAKSFGKTSGWTVGLVLLPVVFLPVLGYGRSRYLGRGALMGPVGYAPQGAYGQPPYGDQQGRYGQQPPYDQPGQQHGYGTAPQDPYGRPQQPSPYGEQPGPYGEQPSPYGEQPGPDSPRR